MKLYRIRRWSEIYENNRSRTVEELRWVLVPNRHDGEHYTAIITHKDGSKIFSAWVLLIQIASRCNPRGTLIRDSGQPHTPLSLSLKTRAPQDWFELALSFLESHTDWLEFEEVAGACHPTVSQVSGTCHPSDDRMEWNGMELKGMEEKCQRRVSAVRILQELNKLSGRKFRESDESLIPIMARLSEPEVTESGAVTMIKRQVVMWKTNPRMCEFLRPSTLFGPKHFNEYYAAKDLPTNETNQQNNSKRFDRTEGTHLKLTSPDQFESAVTKPPKTNELPGL